MFLPAGSCVPCCQNLTKTFAFGWSFFGSMMLVMLQVVLSSPHLGNVRFLWKKWQLLRAMMCVGRYMLGTYVVLARHCMLMDKGKTLEGNSIHNWWHGTVMVQYSGQNIATDLTDMVWCSDLLIDVSVDSFSTIGHLIPMPPWSNLEWFWDSESTAL